MTKIKKQDIERILEKYQQDIPLADIAKEYGVVPQTISYHAGKAGIYRHQFPLLTVARVRELADKGMTANAIARETGCHYQTIQRFAAKHEITLCTRRVFSEKEDNYIAENWGIIPVSEMAKKLKTDPDTIYHKIYAMGGSPRVELDNFTVVQIAELTGISRYTLRYWVKSGRIKSRKKPNARGHHKIPKKELIRWLKAEDRLTEDLAAFLCD